MMPGHVFRFVAGALAILSFPGCQHLPGSENSTEPAQFYLRTSNDRDERIVTDVRINHRPARLALDTGTAAPFVLFAPSVARLKLKVLITPAANPNPTPGRANLGTTAPTPVEVLGQKIPALQFPFVEFPSEIALGDDCQGFIGWPAVRDNVLIFLFGAPEPVIDMVGSITSLDQTWTTLTVAEDDTLSLQFPKASPGTPRLIIDTGSGDGVLLMPARWREWSAAHPDAPRTIHAKHIAGQKLATAEVAWADELRIGELVLHGVPVGEADPAYVLEAADGEEIAALGVAALRRIDLIVDAPNKAAYARALESPPVPYQHNRAGVEFIPDKEGTDDLMAHVLAGGPAFRSGVRDGDLLLRVNHRAVTGWRKEPEKIHTVFNTRAPAGTKWELTVRRDGATQTFNVFAEDLLGPGLKSAPPR